MVNFNSGDYSKTCLKRPLKRRSIIGFKTYYRLMQIKVLQNTFDFIKLPVVIKIFDLSIFERPLKTGFTVPPYRDTN